MKRKTQENTKTMFFTMVDDSNQIDSHIFLPPGQLETNIFEDTLRETFGVNSYVAFTMDKLIQNVVRQVCVVRHLRLSSLFLSSLYLDSNFV